MATNNNLGDLLTSIANAIRTKKKTTNPINAQDFASEIESIESGSSVNKMKNYLDITKSCKNMFDNITTLTKEQLDTTIAEEDTSNVTDMGYMFQNCWSLKTIPSLDTSNVTNMSYMFRNCKLLTSIPVLNTSNVTDMSSMFYACNSLETIHMVGMKVNFDISASTLFTREALVEILNNLATVTTTKTLTMGRTNLAKLTDEDKAIATNKGWTLA